MKTLLDLIGRAPVPEPWAEGDKIPWHDPAFSARMLREHLDPGHDLASPRPEKVDRHVGWIHGELLGGRPGRVLDLGCGPGLYTRRLAALGHTCVGVDFSPASVAHARQQAVAAGLEARCTYLEQDLRQEGDWGAGFDLAMMLEGEINAFRPEEAAALLARAHRALTPAGQLLLAASSPAYFEPAEPVVRTWHAAEGGLFSERPHLYLTEVFWDAARRVRTTRYLVVDAATAAVTSCASSDQAYGREEYEALLGAAGYGPVRYWPPLYGMDHPGYDVVMTAPA